IRIALMLEELQLLLLLIGRMRVVAGMGLLRWLLLVDPILHLRVLLASTALRCTPLRTTEALGAAAKSFPATALSSFSQCVGAEAEGKCKDHNESNVPAVHVGSPASRALAVAAN